MALDFNSLLAILCKIMYNKFILVLRHGTINLVFAVYQYIILKILEVISMKHVKRILVALMKGILFGVGVGLVSRFCQNSETWFRDAYIACLSCAIGCWSGIGMKFFHKDE